MIRIGGSVGIGNHRVFLVFVAGAFLSCCMWLLLLLLYVLGVSHDDGLLYWSRGEYNIYSNGSGLTEQCCCLLLTSAFPMAGHFLSAAAVDGNLCWLPLAAAVPLDICQPHHQ